MTVFGYRTYHDERDKRFTKLIEAMGYAGPQIISGNLTSEELERDPHQRPKLLALLDRLQVGDTLVIEKLSDVAALPSRLTPLLGKLSASPATVFIAELSRHAPIETYAAVLSLASTNFAKLEDEIARLEEKLATTNERVDDYVHACSAAIARRYHEMYEGTAKGLIEGLLTPPVDLTREEPLPPVKEIVEVLDRCRKAHGFSYNDLATLLGCGVATIHRTCQTGRGERLGDLIDLLTRPRGPAPDRPRPANGSAEPAKPPVDAGWVDGAPAVAHRRPSAHSVEVVKEVPQ